MQGGAALSGAALGREGAVRDHAKGPLGQSYSTRTKTVRLNAALRGMPGWVLEAVVAHELAHVFHPDHSPAFWELLGRACPESGRAEAFLAGVGWFARNIEVMPPVERELLSAGGFG